MSLVITTFVPGGIVMASDSRQWVKIEGKTEGKRFKVETISSDAVMKTFLLEEQRVGISNYGQDLLNSVPMESYIKRFIEEELIAEDDVTTIPQKLVEYFRKPFPDADAGFHVAGYRKEGKASIPYVYHCHIAKNIAERSNIKPDDSIAYGATWHGQTDIIASIINPVTAKDEKGADKVIRAPVRILWSTMTLQDAVDFSIYAIRTTIDTMRFQARPKNVGGPIDVLILTPDESKWIQRKELHS